MTKNIFVCVSSNIIAISILPFVLFPVVGNAQSSVDLVEQACGSENTYRNRGQYTRCVQRETNSLVKQGLIEPRERQVVVSAIVNSAVQDPPSMEVDTDDDGVNDSSDNCVANYNPGQEDFDGDSIGDVCDVVVPGICPCSNQWVTEVTDRLESGSFENGLTPGFATSNGLQMSRSYDVFDELSAQEIALYSQQFPNGISYGSTVSVNFSDLDFRNLATVSCNGLFDNSVAYSIQTQMYEVNYSTFISETYDSRQFNDALSCASILHPDANLLEDGDEDGVLDIVDNCVNTFNPNQEDSGGNPRGDACEAT